MALTKVTPIDAGTVGLHLFTRRNPDDGTISAIYGSIEYTVVDATGKDVGAAAVDLAELTASQRTTLTNLITAIRTRVKTEAY